MDKAATTLIFTFFPGMRLQSRCALGLAMSRLLEERVGLAEGTADVRKWLIIISKPTAFPIPCVLAPAAKCPEIFSYTGLLCEHCKIQSAPFTPQVLTHIALASTSGQAFQAAHSFACCLLMCTSAATGCNDEDNWIDVGTVRGYKRVVMCQEVRDEIRAVLGEDEPIKAFLEALYDERLLPTPWLNRVCLQAFTLIGLTVVPGQCSMIPQSCARQAVQALGFPTEALHLLKCCKLTSAQLVEGSGACLEVHQ
jgi:hypothetical protein